MSVKIDFSKLNLQDALDLAILIEKEAEERYLEFAEMVGHKYKGDAGDFFKHMAENEAKHKKQLETQRTQLFKGAPVRVSMEQLYEVEAPDYSKPRSFMSPKHAMQVAFDSEVKAYNFFCEVLKHVTDKDVKALFEELKEEEVVHQNLIKKHMKNVPDTMDPDVDPDDVEEPTGLE